ncbi:MAG: hypothetical protein AB7D39_11250 [Pseudodesulfovibrio sp.]|uniref:hypothetical protein n=1 Tax=Pseudodesulfovibrio sp. TaxID=2035812 RepID=UPI003D1323A3
MKELKKNRAFISTAAAFTFVPTVITSLFLLFHVKFPGIMSIHKWVGLAFVLMCLLHIPINWAVLRKHLNGKAALSSLAITVILTFGMLLVGDTGSHDGKRQAGSGPGYAQTTRLSPYGHKGRF